MMQPRCAICDDDYDVTTLCETHHWLAVIRHHVDCGTISDWPPLTTGTPPTVVKHREMLHRPAYRPLYWQASILALLTTLGVWWNACDGDEKQDSPADWLAVQTGRAAEWFIARWAELLSADDGNHNGNDNGNGDNGKAA